MIGHRLEDALRELGAEHKPRAGWRSRVRNGIAAQGSGTRIARRRPWAWVKCLATRAVLALITLVGCGDNRIAADTACAEQANAWCAAVGYPHSGCEIVYNNGCRPGDDADTIDSGDLAICLDAIAELRRGPLGYAVPPSCLALWALPPSR